jgi:hypothetical protein
LRWKEIENTDGRYLISDEGKVFSAVSNRLIKNQISNKGYERVELNMDGVVRRESVHRLVAAAFIPNPNNYPIVNHKDENPRNNRADNLEWCTYKYNTNYGSCLEKISRNTTYKSGSENPRSMPVFQFTTDGKLVGNYESAYIAAEALNLNAKSISKARKGQLKVYAGYVWSSESTFPKLRKKTHYRAGKVLQYDLDGNFVREYEKPNDTAEAGFNPNSVRDVCRGMQTQHRGYIFKYKENTQ